MSAINVLIFNEILDINTILSTRHDLFSPETGLQDHLTTHHDLLRSEVILRNQPMGCIVTRYQIPRNPGVLFVDVRSNHHVLVAGQLNFHADIVGIKMVADGRVYEPLAFRLQSIAVDRKIGLDITAFLRSFIEGKKSSLNRTHVTRNTNNV